MSEIDDSECDRCGGSLIERDHARGGCPGPLTPVERYRVDVAALRSALATATAERDALRGEVEGLKADLGAAQATADDRFKWRHVVERETAEAIAAFVDTEAEARREEGFSYRAVSELAADIRSGSWKEPK